MDPETTPNDPNAQIPQPTHPPAGDPGAPAAQQPAAQQPAQAPGPQPGVDPDAAFMTGHPAAEPQPQEPAAQQPQAQQPQAQQPAAQQQAPAGDIQAVTMGGQTYYVPAQVAETMRAQQAMIEQTHQQYQAAPQGQAQPPAPAQDQIDPDLIYTDPARYTELVQEQAVARAKAEMTAEYKRDQGLQHFFSDFYSKHNDLKDSDDLVRQELQANYNAWANKPAREVHDLLADKVRNRILGYVSRYGSTTSGGNQTPRTTVEGGPQHQVQQPAPQAEPPKTASNIVAMRRAKRRQAGG